MKNILILCVFLVTVAAGCQEITVGYLETVNAIYSPDSMVVKAVLDPDIDAKRINFKIPWQSTSLEGVLGTDPVLYSITGITCDEPDVPGQFSMRGKGIIELPYNHSVPPGRYVFKIRIENEGYAVELDSMYTVIVR